MSAISWVRNAFVKAPQTKSKRVRVTRAVIRRANANDHPWDAPVYHGEIYDYDQKAPRL